MRTLIGLLSVALLATLGAAIERPDTLGASQSELACRVMNAERLPLDARASPLDSVTLTVAGSLVKVCYGRPSARDREIFGGLLPYGKLWRTGANEPTMIHSTGGLEIAGVRVPAGSHSLYTVPGPEEWTVIVNRSISQWGHESQYTEQVQAQEAGRGTVRSESTDEHVETFTMRAQPSGEGAARLVLEWERTRVAIPIRTSAGASSR